MTSFGADHETRVGIDGRKFTVNGAPTYEGQTYRGHDVEGLLFNSRMIQALFDDENAETVGNWAYPDTGRYDPERNVREFLAAMPKWRAHGLRAVTVNLQCGSPEGYSDEQPWVVSAYRPDGSLKPAWLDRLRRVLDFADELGMVVILGLFYFGQDGHVRDESTLRSAVDDVLDWLLHREYTNVVIEACNESNVSYDEHEILGPDRVSEIIEQVARTERDGWSFPVGTSFGGGKVPPDDVIGASDVVFLHGNGVDDPDRIAEMVREVRASPAYDDQPVVFNEDDHFGFDAKPNNCVAALSEHASWGYFDPGDNDYHHGYQSPPVEWTINTGRKRAFFDYVSQVTDSDPGPAETTAGSK